jgi:hypothetical protein
VTVNRNTTITELDANTPELGEEQVAALAAQLAGAHDNLQMWMRGEAYVSVSASWKGKGGTLVTLSVSSSEPDEDDDFEEEDA